MKPTRFVLTTTFLLVPAAMMGCHSSGSTPTTQTADAPATDPSEKVYPPAPAGTPFASIKVGMDSQQVVALIGSPTSQGAYMTGKSFIPFYYGGDTHRIQYNYKDQGRIILSPDSRFTSSLSVIEIEYDPTETGYSH
jgi:outer membrane protein assembly factor BamE (lipoprotein component of BamABCDE complex)